MEAVLIDAAVELLKVVAKPLKKAFVCKKNCEQLKNKLEGMIPILKKVFQPGVELSEERQKPLTEFHEALKEGKNLVEACSKVNPWSFFVLLKYAQQIDALARRIDEFIRTQGWALSYTKLYDVEVKVGNVEHKIENLTVNCEAQSQTIRRFMDRLENDQNVFPLSIPKLPNYTCGLEISVRELKKRLLRDADPLIGVVGMGGSGKTTLVKALCNDTDVQDHFKKRIIYEKVSQKPNIMEILRRMWRKMVPKHEPNFGDIEDARGQMQEKFFLNGPQATLVVLDDVWEKDDLANLMFEGEGCQTLITTRNNDMVGPDQRYEKQLLEISDAVPLFCHWAFGIGQRSIPETVDNDLVREIINRCDGLPLALQVIGTSLRERPREAWVTAKNNLCQGKPVSYDHKKALTVMATSVYILEKEVQECFLDMGIFPQARKISAALLLDLGVYVHGLRLEEAYTILIELVTRNLVTLVNNQKDTLWSYYDSSRRDILFTQHDVLRELALYLTKQKHLTDARKRFIMHIQKGDSICKNAECSSDAEIVSFNTGSMEEADWCEINFPNAKALILNVSASECFLPPFMKSMQKLEVLMIFNHNAKRATLKGVRSVFPSLTQLKVVHLEGVIVPPLQDYCQSWQKLQKLSFVLCENMILDLNFPLLLEFTIDHCINVTELPSTISQMNSLQRLSVTNCHDLEKLSDGIGKLGSLQIFRLNACLKLKELPNSICELRKLEFLDISLCHGITQLPEQLGQLSSLKKLDMRECSRLKQLPRSASELRSHVQRVICDEKIQLQWSNIVGSHKVEVAEEKFTLTWLQN